MGALFWFNPLRQISSSVGTRLLMRLVRKTFTITLSPLHRFVWAVWPHGSKPLGFLLNRHKLCESDECSVFFFFFNCFYCPPFGTIVSHWTSGLSSAPEHVSIWDQFDLSFRAGISLSILSFLGLAFLFLKFKSKRPSLETPTDWEERHSAFSAILNSFKAWKSGITQSWVLCRPRKCQDVEWWCLVSVVREPQPGICLVRASRECSS